MSLRALTILFLMAFGGATLLTGFATFSASRTAIIALVDRRIAAASDDLLTEVALGDAAAILARIDAFSRRRETGDIGFELEDASGRRLGGNVTLARAMPLGFSSLRSVDGIAGLSAGRAAVREAGRGLRLIAVAETEPIDGFAAIRIRNYVIGFGAIALIVVAGTASFGLLVHRRIGEVRATAEAIVDGDLDRRVPVSSGGGVFAAQAVAFNRMLDRIAVLMGSIRSVSGDVAHDLRTPLAKLRGHLAAMSAQRLELDRDAALDQCDALLAMFAAILRLSEIEAGQRRKGFTTLALDELACEVLETLTPAAAEGGHRLLADALAPVWVEGDRQLLSQALLNLVENAMRHTPAGSTIRVALERLPAGAALQVRDDGPGIAVADRATALRRFGRLDRSRHRPGHGLGLPLVDAVARLHGGALTLTEAAPGLIVTLALPGRAVASKPLRS